jgi:aminomethyltransferase
LAADRVLDALDDDDPGSGASGPTDASRNAEKLWELVLEAGKPHGLAVIGPCHIRRIEGGILAYGADMWLDTNPYEVEMGYEWMVDLDQEADFIGKEALRRIKEAGIRRKLVGVEIGGKKLGSYNDGTMIDFFPIYANGDRIGNVTSACHSPRLEKNIGYAMVPIEFAEFGTEVAVETPDEQTSAVVVPRPFIDARKEIPRQDLAAAAKDD